MAAQDHSATPLAKKLGAKPGAGVVVFFTTSREHLERRFAALKTASIDESWRALRFVYRLGERQV